MALQKEVAGFAREWRNGSARALEVSSFPQWMQGKQHRFAKLKRGMDMKTKIAGIVSRRTLFKAGAALGGGIIASGMPLTQAIWAAEGKVLNARANADLSKLDPAFVVTDAEVDVMHCIYSKLTRYKSGSDWGWELEAAERIEQVDPTHVRFRLKKGIKFTSGYGEMTARDIVRRRSSHPKAISRRPKSSWKRPVSAI